MASDGYAPAWSPAKWGHMEYALGVPLRVRGAWRVAQVIPSSGTDILIVVGVGGAAVICLAVLYYVKRMR